MLKVNRTRPSPSFFDALERPRDKLLEWASRTLEERRQRRAPIDHDIFRSSAMVDAVVTDFEGRCAYCEREIGHSEGIGHFRPLSIEQRAGEEEEADHYSWLAFEWLNLLLLCRRCQKAKAGQFPVTGGRRAPFLSTFDQVREVEKPNLIDPTIDNPSHYISYLTQGTCFPRKKSRKGTITIKVLNLNDEILVLERREAINQCLESWRSSLASRSRLPTDFLQSGPHLGACREIILRTLSKYSPRGVSVNDVTKLRRYLNHFLTIIKDEELKSIMTVIDQMKRWDHGESEEELRPALREPRMDVSSRPARDSPPLSLAKGGLASLHISNFRAIDYVEIPFSKVREKKAGTPCLLLLGENAVGKSTCLSSMALALLGTREASNLQLPYYELARSIKRTTWNLWGKAPLEVRVRFHDERKLAEFVYDPTRNLLDGTEEQSAVVIGYGPHRYFANAKGHRRKAPADRVRSLFDPRMPLPDPSDWLKALSGSQFDQVARTIRTILPTGDDDHLVKDPQAGICVLAQGQLTPVSHLSEGYRAMFAMVADICRSLLDHWSNLETAQAVVLIDEIETHLHPRWKMRAMSSLRNAFPGVQFVATTHDPLCLRGMDDGEVIVLARDEDGSVHILEDLPPISGMRAEQILTSDYFGLSSTVDPEIHLEIARIAEGLQANEVRDIGAEARDLVDKLALGNSATAQIIHAALQKYLRERERTNNGLSHNTRSEAVAAVFKALRASRED